MAKTSVKDDTRQKEIDKITSRLVQSGKKAGFIQYDDIVKAYSQLSLTEQEFDRIWVKFDKAGILVQMEEDMEDIPDDELEPIDEESIKKELDDIENDPTISNMDPVKQYLREIGNIPLLTVEDEASLSERVINGHEAQAEAERLKVQISAIEQSEAEERSAKKELASLKKELQKKERIIEDGHEAVKTLVSSNLRLVVSVAKKFVGRGLMFLDLLQEGNIGLIRAAEKFDYRKGYKFSTYSVWWIRQSISRSVADSGRTIRIPVHVVETINKINRTRKIMAQELSREPSYAEIAEELDMTEDKVRSIIQTSLEPVSLEMPIGEEGDTSLADFVTDEESETPADAATASLMREHLLSLLEKLDPRERDIIKLRFGLADGRPRTLEEIGEIYHITRERVRQLEAKALKTLRHPKRIKSIQDYMYSM